MSFSKLTCEKVFGSTENDGKLLLEESEKLLSNFVFDAACEAVCENRQSDEDDDDESDDDDDKDSVDSFEKLEATLENFGRIIEIFKRAKKSKENFLKSFEKVSPEWRNKIDDLRKIAKAIQTNKFNSDISRLIGSLIGAIGGITLCISFFTPLAPVVAAGAAIAHGVGGFCVAGTTTKELFFMKEKLNDAKAKIKELENGFKTMADWFTYPEELRKAIESLVNYSLLKKMAEDLKKFFDQVKSQTNLTVGEFKVKFKEALKSCMSMMMKDSKLSFQFGDEIKPIVMTFIFVVCLLKGENRIILDCVLITQRFSLGVMSLLNPGIEVAKLIAARLAKAGAAVAGEALVEFGLTEALVALGVVIDVANVLVSAYDLYNRPETELTKKINDAAEKIEKTFLFIENVYDELKKWKAIPMSDVAEWTTIIVNYVPDDAEQVHIRRAVKEYLPEEARGCIKLKRLPTNGNNWQVKVPATHSQLLLEQFDIVINGNSCNITK